MNSQKQILLQSLKQKGFSKEILNAFSKVKRENFIPKNLKREAYEDNALPIGQGQTISQPYTIAMMLSLLELKTGQRVLEIGSGCGYVLALISEIIKSNGKVFGIEIIKELTEKSKLNLKEYKNIKVYNRNGTRVLREKTSISHEQKLKGGVDLTMRGSLYFDRILISARSEEIPKPLISQLKNNGVIVAPLGNSYEQSLISFKKTKGELKLKKEIPGFVFVPLVDG